jgi:hypothetical protein
MWQWLGAGVSDIGSKFWKLLKIGCPLLGVLEFARWGVQGLWKGTVDWGMAKIDSAIASLNIDLALPLSPWLAKANSIFPIEEAVHYLVLYLGIASIVVGVKWMRNLVPGAS